MLRPFRRVSFSAALVAASFASAPGFAQSVLFDFNSAPIHTSLPIDQTVSGITAHLSATGQGFSIQGPGSPVYPQGFSGLFIYPNSIFKADLLVGFSVPVTSFSIRYAPDELGCDDSATMRVTAYSGGTYVGTATKTASNPGTYPVDTLACAFPQGFDSVVVHWDSKPPTCTDYGVIFFADDMRVTPAAPAAPTVASLAPNHGSQSGNVPVVISGAGFSGVTAVKVGGVPVTSFSVVNATTIQATLPSLASGGWLDVKVTNAGGTGTLTGGYDAFVPPTTIGADCSTPSLVWSGAPCLGQDYTVTPTGVGSGSAALVVSWSNVNTHHGVAFFGSTACPPSACGVYVPAHQALVLGPAGSHTFSIPNDPSFVGAHLGVQALIRGCPNVTTRALDAVIGL
jgi:hypothetical protein